jgi:hypothetical protein
VFLLFGVSTVAFALCLAAVVSRTRTAISISFAIITVGLIYLLLLPGFWYVWYVDLTKTLEGGVPSSGTTIGWVLGTIMPIFQFAQLYIDISLRSTGSTDPVTAEFVQGPGMCRVSSF